MFCQGHNKTNQSMFWIQFDKSVSKDDILNFMKHHSNKYGSFCSSGRFAKRIFGFRNRFNGVYEKDESWNYFAATVDAAHNDLRMWKGDTYTYEEQTGKILKNDEWIKV